MRAKASGTQEQSQASKRTGNQYSMSFNSSLMRYTRITEYAFYSSSVSDPSHILKTATVRGRGKEDMAGN